MAEQIHRLTVRLPQRLMPQLDELRRRKEFERGHIMTLNGTVAELVSDRLRDEQAQREPQPAAATT